MKRIIILLLLVQLVLVAAALPVEPTVVYLPYVSVWHEDIRFLDCDGQPTTQEWITEQFGPVTWQRGSGARLTGLACDNSGIAALLVRVVDTEGNPVGGVTVIRYWPDAPLLPDELVGWFDRGVYGETKEDGTIGFAMGFGDYYFPPNGGASCIWVHPGGDLLCGLGMLGGTNHISLNSDWALP